MSDETLRAPSPGNSTPSSPAQPPPRRGHLWVWLIAIVAVAIAGFIYSQHRMKDVKAQSQGGRAAGGPPALPVTTDAARKGSIGVYVNALGTVVPVYTVTVTSRVQGQIMEVYYREGQIVHKDDPLLDIDPRPYQAQVTQFEGQLARDEALLSEARIDFDRYTAAFARNAIAKQQLDDQEQIVRQYEGTVKNDQGQVDNAKVNLAYCHITSPIEGRVGLRPVDPGNIVQANSTTPLVVITQLQPITLMFSVAEDYVPQIQQQLSRGHQLPVDALDRAQEKKIASGTLLTMDNQIDTTTGTVRLRANFANQDLSLFPNQFVNARLLVETQNGVTLIPVPAIQRNAQGAFVYVVKSDQTVSMRTIMVGTTEANQASVQGIEPGEIIVTNGFDKLQDGIKVNITSGPGKSTDSGTSGGEPGTRGRQRQ